MSGYPRWMRQDNTAERRETDVQSMWSRLRKSPPVASLPKARSAEQGAHAELRVPHPCSSDRGMPVSGSDHGCVAFVERSPRAQRLKVPKG